MKQKIILILVTVLLTFGAVACGAPASEGTAETAGESAAPAAEPTEAAEEEASDAEVSEAEDAGDEEESTGEEVTYTVDPAASSVVWVGSKPLQYSHTGTVDVAEGSMTFAGTELTGGTFTIDMTTISNDDLSGSDKADLEAHLNSEDFFGTETFPTASLMLKSAEPTDVENQYTVVADLTIKEITNEITFVTDVELGEGMLTAAADFVIDRAAFDVRFGSGSFFDDLGDKLISDEIEMSVTLVAQS